MDPRFKREGEGVRPISILVHPSRVLSRGYILFSSSVSAFDKTAIKDLPTKMHISKCDAHQEAKRGSAREPKRQVPRLRKKKKAEQMHMTGNQSFSFINK